MPGWTCQRWHRAKWALHGWLNHEGQPMAVIPAGTFTNTMAVLNASQLSSTLPILMDDVNCQVSGVQ